MPITPPLYARIDWGLIIKLIIWSLVVGIILYWLNLSPGTIYGWVLEKFAGAWDWFSGSGIQYILLGASIVVPLYLLSRIAGRTRRD